MSLRGRGMQGPLLLCCAALLVTLGLAAPAWAARRSVSIESPARAQGAVGSALTVRLRVSSAVRRVRVFVDQTEFTGRMHRNGNSVTGRITGLRPGPHQLLAVAGDAAGHESRARRQFVTGRRSTGLVHVVHAPPHVSSAAPVAVRLRLVRGARLVAALNGAKATDAFVRRGHVRRAKLSATFGLHHGHNLLRVLAYRDDGSFQVIKRRLVLRRDRPLAAAGRDTSAVVGGHIRLDAGASLPLRRGDAVRYRWRIVRAPHGSRERVVASRKPSAAIVLDRVGTYRVQLRVAERKRGRRAAAATTSARRATASASGATTSAPDEVTVTSQANVPPIGVPITTIYHVSQPNSLGVTGIRTGAPFKHFYANPDSETELLVLDRQTLQRDKAVPLTYDTTTASGAQELVQQIEDAPQGYLVILADPGTNGPFINSAEANQFNQAINGIGANSYSAQQLADELPTSIIGVQGVPVGQAYQNSVGVLGTGDIHDLSRPGSIDGFLAQDATGNYAFSWPDYVPFQTSAASGQVSVTINGRTESVNATTPNGIGAFVYDCRSLVPLGEPTFMPVDGAATDPGALVSYLQNAIGQGDCMVVLQSIGTIQPQTPAWAQLAQEIGSLGGTPSVFNTVNGAYTLVGGTDLTDPAAEESTGMTGKGNGTLQGILKRNRESSFAANLADPFSIADFSLAQLAYQPPTVWPEMGHPPREAGIEYWTKKFLSESKIDYPNLRLNYWADSGVDWIGMKPSASNCPATSSIGGYTQAGCEWAADELRQEFTWVDNILRGAAGELNTGLIAHLQDPFTASTNYNSADLNEIATGIEDDVGGGSSQASGSVFDVMSGLFDGISYTVGDAYEPIFGLIGAAASIAEPFANDGSGASTLQQVQTEAANLGLQVANDYQTETSALSRLGAILVSDYAKLKTAGQNSTGNKKWGFAIPTTVNSLSTALEQSASQFFYGSLINAAYHSWQLPVKDYTGSTSWTPNAQQFSCPNGVNLVNPFADSPSDGTGQFVAVTGFSSSMTPTTTTYVWGNSSGEGNHYQTPPDSLTKDLFTSITNGGFGLFKPWFWSRNFSPKLFGDATIGCS